MQKAQIPVKRVAAGGQIQRQTDDPAAGFGVKGRAALLHKFQIAQQGGTVQPVHRQQAAALVDAVDARRPFHQKEQPVHPAAGCDKVFPFFKTEPLKGQAGRIEQAAHVAGRQQSFDPIWVVNAFHRASLRLECDRWHRKMPGVLLY